MRSKRIREPLSHGLFAAFLLPAALFAHPNGTSKIEIRLIDPDSVSVSIDVNSDDLMGAVRASVKTWGGAEKQKADAALFQAKVANYLLARVRPETDAGLIELQVARWKPGGRGPDDGFGEDSAAYNLPNKIITLGGVLPKRRAWLRLSVQLFLELGVQPVSEISLFWKDSLVQRTWIGLDRVLVLPLDPDSLTARLAERQKGSSASVTRGGVFLRFITIGFTHILPFGLDHVLFVLGLFFFSTRIRPLLVQITAFTVAHSLTLGLSLVGVIGLPSRVVEPIIALSIAIVALENIFHRKSGAWRWLIVFGFGLIHGLGFAGALREFGLPPGSFWSTLAGFNLGVELGQIAVVLAAFAFTRWFWSKPWYARRIAMPVSGAIFLVALYWAVERIFG